MGGSWVPIEDFEATLDVPEIPPNERRGVRTLGSFIMTLLGRVPKPGERVEWDGLRFEVSKMDGRRIALVLVTKLVRTNVLPAVAKAADGTRSG